MENGRKTFVEKYRSWAYQHLVLKRVLEYGWLFLVSTVGAFIFAFSFRVFLQPDVKAIGDAVTANEVGVPVQIIISGGVSGISQNLALLLLLICRNLGDAGMDIYAAADAVRAQKPDAVVVDSVQTMYSEEIGSAAGSVSQVREVTNVMMQLAKQIITH